MSNVAATNEEAAEAWNGVLFDRFVQYRHLVSAGLGAHGEEALRIHPPAPGERALDIGCGFGDTTRQIAELVGPQGSVLGFDVSERFIEPGPRGGRGGRRSRTCASPSATCR